MESPSLYRNFIINDPILDYLTYYDTFYKMDNELSGFDEEFQLKYYIDNNKTIFCEKIYEEIRDDCIRLSYDSFLMRTSKLKKYFKNGKEYKGYSYSFFTIEYSTINILKNGNVSYSHKYYNFKNWFLKNQSLYKIDYCFIIGRKYNKYKSYNYLAKMPYVFDELLVESREHLQLVRYKKIGIDIFPNMKNISDYPWHNAKKIISKEICELTSVKGISNKDRDKLVSIGITNYTEIDLKKHEQFFHNEKKLPLISEDNTTVLFIDFEILTNVYDDFSNFPQANDKEYIFNIGYTNIGQKEDTSYFIRNLKDEENMIKDFLDLLNMKKNVTLIHWTNIEKRLFYKKINEYNLHINCNIQWFDLHEYFVKSEIYIENCLNYKLKNVSRCLKSKNLIKSEWNTGSFCDGLGAMTGYIKYLRTFDESILNKIIQYNLIDCKVMEEIYNLIKMDLDIPDC